MQLQSPSHKLLFATTLFLLVVIVKQLDVATSVACDDEPVPAHTY